MPKRQEPGHQNPAKVNDRSVRAWLARPLARAIVRAVEHDSDLRLELTKIVAAELRDYPNVYGVPRLVRDALPAKPSRDPLPPPPPVDMTVGPGDGAALTGLALGLLFLLMLGAAIWIGGK